MSIRWRADGRLLCAAKCEAEEGDTYIDDRLHYELSVERQVLVASEDHFNDGLWFWNGLNQSEIHERDSARAEEES